METTMDKINVLRAKEAVIDDAIQVYYRKTEEIRKEKANFILKYFKEEKMFGFMTWTYLGDKLGNKIYLKAKEDWEKCPEEIIDLLRPDYHDHFYFSEYDPEINEIESGVKMGLHFDDGEIHISIEIDNEKDKDKMITFIREYGLNIKTDGLEEQIRDHQKEIDKKQKILNFFKGVNG